MVTGEGSGSYWKRSARGRDNHTRINTHDGNRQQRDATRLTVEPKQRAPTLRIITSMRWTGKRNNNPKVLTATIDSHHPNDHRKPRAQRFSVHLLALRARFFFVPHSFRHAVSTRRAGRQRVHPRSLSPAECGSLPSFPIRREWQKDLRQLLDKFLLQFRRKHQVAVALFFGRQRGENPASHAEVSRTHVRAFVCAFEAQSKPAKINALIVVPFSGRPACASRALRVEPRRHRLQQSSGGFPGMAGGKLAAQFDYWKLRASVAEGLRRGRGRNQAGPANKRSKRVTRIRIRASLMRPLVCTSYPAPRNSSRK